MTKFSLRSILMAAAGVSALAMAGGAAAADLNYSNPSPYGAPSRVASAWQGFYVGVHAGYTWAGYDARLTPGPTDFRVNGNSFSGGLFGGYNHHITPNWVAGLEADVTLVNPTGGNLVGGAFYYGKTGPQGTARGRIGYAFDQFLIYGTGGLALGRMEFASLTGGGSATKIGYALGLGVEGQITGNIFARAEYLYTALGADNFNMGGGINVRSDVATHTVRLGVGYKF